jgi:hypothetical protein
MGNTSTKCQGPGHTEDPDPGMVTTAACSLETGPGHLPGGQGGKGQVSGCQAPPLGKVFPRHQLLWGRKGLVPGQIHPSQNTFPC